MPSTAPAISIQNLTRRFRETTAVDRLSFDVHPGAICGVVGPNGAGKSTTFRILCGLLRPSSGVAMVLGRDVSNDSGAVATCIGLLPETPHFYPYMSGERNLQALADLSAVPNSRARCRELLRLTGLAAAAERRGAASPAGRRQPLPPRPGLLPKPPPPL